MASPPEAAWDSRPVDDEEAGGEERTVLLPKKSWKEDSGTSTTATTVYNIVNVYVGLGLLSQPYALAKGGWVAILALLMFCMFSKYTGVLIVRCFKRLDFTPYANKGGYTYPNLGHLLLGHSGSVAIFVFAILELIGVLSMCQVILWSSIHSMIPEASLVLVALLSTVGMLPVLYLPSFSKLKLVGVMGSLSSLFVALTTLVVYVTSSSAWLSDAEHKANRRLMVPSTLPMAIGIMMLSFAAHATLPLVHSSMKDRSQYNNVLNISFSTMFLLYSAVGVFGYMIWGEDCQVLITDNLRESASRGWQKMFVSLVVFFVAVKAFSTAIPVIFVIVEFLPTRSDMSPNMSWGLRCMCCIVVGMASYVAQAYLEYVEALTGGVCALATTLTFPLLFYYLSHRPVLDSFQKGRTLLLFAFSVLLMIFIFISSISDLSEKTKTLKKRPVTYISKK